MAKRKLAYPIYRQPSQVVFGTGSVRTLADADGFEDTVFLMSRQPSVRVAVQTAFDRHGRSLDDLQVLEKPGGEPTEASVGAGAEWLRARSFEHVVVIGGGSTLDWARLSVAAARGWLSPATGAMDPQAGRSPRPSLTLVPTTCGSGAEAAGVAVYTVAGRKLGIVSPAFVAERVILDGQFLNGIDAGLLHASVSDALTHAIEAYASIVPNALAKEAALSTLQLILEHASSPPSSCRNERLMEAGYLGGVAASNCSVGVVHAFAHAVGPLGVPHGVANALGLVAGIRTNANTPAMQALVRRSGLGTADGLIAAIQPITTGALATGLAAAALRALADAESRDRVVTSMMADVCVRSNPRSLTAADISAFLDQVQRTAPAV
jgi:alcohol dehydrogenase class IV